MGSDSARIIIYYTFFVSNFAAVSENSLGQWGQCLYVIHLFFGCTLAIQLSELQRKTTPQHKHCMLLAHLEFLLVWLLNVGNFTECNSLLFKFDLGHCQHISFMFTCVILLLFMLKTTCMLFIQLFWKC